MSFSEQRPPSSMSLARLRLTVVLAGLSVLWLFELPVFAQPNPTPSVTTGRSSTAPRAIDSVSLLEASANREANPYLSFLPADVDPDLDAWRVRLHAAASLKTRGPISQSYEEEEGTAVIGANDQVSLAEDLPILRSGAQLLVRGQVLTTEVDLTDFGVMGGDHGGSIPEAVGLEAAGVEEGERYIGTGAIGDGPFGSGGTGSGDFDMFSIDGSAGQRLSVFVETPDPASDLDAGVSILNSSGVVIASADSIIEGGFLVSSDAALTLRLPLDDTYTIVVAGSDEFGPLLPSDPFDASSGQGIGTEGSYALRVTVEPASLYSRDLFAIELEAGDVFGATLVGGEKHRVGLLNPDGQLMVASRFDLSGLYPLGSPLPGGGEASVAYVVPSSGRYFLMLEAASPFATDQYEVQCGRFRSAGPLAEPTTPPLVLATDRSRGPSNEPQSLFLDFDGAIVDRSIFFGSVPDPMPVELSPLASFLQRWSLTAGSESALIDVVVSVVEQELSSRVRAIGSNGDYQQAQEAGRFDITVRNSRDHAPLPSDAIVVVGGSVEELNIRTIGIAEAIDPGNFVRAKTGVVLLDLLSEVSSNPNSLNRFAVDPSSSVVELVGTALGRIAAHEAGHLFGNFHTERDVGPASMMDSGGRLDLLLGVGVDGVFGTGDDMPLNLRTDEYSRREVFVGDQETLEVVSFGLPRGVGHVLRSAPSVLSFGMVPPGGSDISELMLRNEGEDPISITGFDLPDGVFQVGGFVPVGLNPGGDTSLSVSFSPSATGAFEELLSVQVAGQPDLAVLLRGVSGLSTINLIGLPAVDPILELPPIVYGPLTTTSRTVTVMNSGDAPLELAHRLGGSRAGRFRVEPVGGLGNHFRGATRIEPGGQLELDVIFDPAGAIGQASATLHFADTFGGAAPVGLELRSRSDGPNITVNPRPYSFGALRADGSSGRRSFRVRNEGTLPLRVTGAELREGTPSTFELSAPNLPRNLAPQQQLLVPVEFTPTDAIRYDGFLDIGSADPDEPLAVVQMVGLGLLPMLEVSPPSINVGLVPSGESATALLTLFNVGGATLRGSFRIDGGAGVWSAVPAPGTLVISPESTLEIEVAYDAPEDSSQPVPAVLVLETDDRDRPVISVPLQAGSLVEVPTSGPVGRTFFALALVVAFFLIRRRG